MAALVIPGASDILGVARQQMALVASLIRMAMSPRVHGSGHAVDNTHKFRDIASCITSKAALERQREGWEYWLAHTVKPQDNPEHIDVDAVLGFTGMWGEAGQKAKALRACMK